MEDQRAQELRDAFNHVPDDHVLTVAEVDFVPAILGRGIQWSWSTTNGVLISITAYEQHIETAGDLRRVAQAHPRTEETDTDASTAFAQTFARFIGPLQQWAVWSRLRMRALLRVLESRFPGFYQEYDAALRAVAEVDFHAFTDQIQTSLTDEEYKDKYSEWLDTQNKYMAEFIGEEAATRLNQQWKEFFRGIAGAATPPAPKDDP